MQVLRGQRRLHFRITTGTFMTQIIHPGECRSLTNPHGGDRRNEIYIFIIFCRYVEISTIYADCLDVAQAIRPATPGNHKKRGRKAGFGHMNKISFFVQGNTLCGAWHSSQADRENPSAWLLSFVPRSQITEHNGKSQKNDTYRKRE